MESDQFDRVLEHLVSVAQVDKAYAWWAAKNYAEINPYQLADMPAQLKVRMIAQKEKVNDGSI